MQKVQNLILCKSTILNIDSSINDHLESCVQFFLRGGVTIGDFGTGGKIFLLKYLKEEAVLIYG